MAKTSKSSGSARAKPITGFDLVRKMIDAYPDNPVEKLLNCTGGETEYLELKATCVFDPSDNKHNKPGETQGDLSWNIARELLALHNSKGGLLIIGIDDKRPFERVALPDFQGSNPNDYIERMVLSKILPKNCEWSTKKGAETYSCDKAKLSSFRREYLSPEYLQYHDGKVVALFVKPAPCQDGSCIGVSFKKNQSDAYDQILVRQTGITGGVQTLTTDKDKQQHEKTRHSTDSEFTRLWAKWRPHDDSQHSSQTPSKRQEATAEEGSNPADDPLIRALEGRMLETEFMQGQTVAGYRIVRRIGNGGMGAVYEVEHPGLKVTRALKVFAPPEEDDTELLERKFLTEARLLARLNHPGLVRVHTLGVAPNTATLYYEMDLIRSPDNQTRTFKDIYNNIKDDPPSNRKLRKWFAELCNVLTYLHERQKVVHRDIKLENILLNERGFAVLTDFGIARIKNETLKSSLEDVTINPTANGNGDAIVGTREYLAPELENEKASAKSDIYALGVVFFKLLTGRHYDRESGEDLRKLLKGKPLFWRRNLPKLLARDPKDRIGDLSRYAVRTKYPRKGFLFWTALALVAYALLHLSVCGIRLWNSEDKVATLKSLWPVQITQNADATPSDVNFNDLAGDKLTSDESETFFATSSPSRRQKQSNRRAKPDNDSSYTEDEIKTAQEDLSRLCCRYLNEQLRFARGRSLDEDPVPGEIASLHSKIYSVWKEITKLRNLGMTIEETFKSRKDLVNGCVDIRRNASTKIQELIDQAEYEQALRLFTATNEELSSCGFKEIPRPSFTPPDDTDE